MVVKDVSLWQCAGIGFFIKENNITAVLIDHLRHECRDKKKTWIQQHKAL
jgi:primase-polymerase (primpol)-like protein